MGKRRLNTLSIEENCTTACRSERYNPECSNSLYLFNCRLSNSSRCFLDRIIMRDMCTEDRRRHRLQRGTTTLASYYTAFCQLSEVPAIHSLPTSDHDSCLFPWGACTMRCENQTYKTIKSAANRNLSSRSEFSESSSSPLVFRRELFTRSIA